MKLKPAFKDEFQYVNINWSELIEYEKFTEDRYIHETDYTMFYCILGQYSDFSFKVFYIGKVYKQYIRDRIRQPDHKRRYNKIKKFYPKHQLYITVGTIQLRGKSKITSFKIDQIESILIYSHWNEAMINEKNIFNYNVKNPYIIINDTPKELPLHKEIHLGVFVR